MLSDVIYYVVVIILPLVVAYYVKLYYVYKDLKGLQGPFPLPFFGNILDFNTKTGMLTALQNYTIKYGEDVPVVMGPYPKILLTNSDTIGLVATSTNFHEKDQLYKFFGKWLGEGLLTSTGKKWLQRRKLITPTFHFKILNNFIPTFESIGDILIGKLNDKVGPTSFDVFPMITLYSLDIICETALGVPVNAQTKSDSEYVLGVREILNVMTERGFSIMKYYDLPYFFFRDYWRNCALTKMLRGYTFRIIRKRREENLQFNDDLEDEFGIKQRVAFLDMLLKSTIDGKLLSDDDIREEVDTFIFEGHDTTSTAISFAIYTLSNEHEVQNTIVEELSGIFGDDKDRHATYEELNNMPYLDMVIKEVLRFYPSVPLFGRIVKEDVKFEKGTIRGGTGIFLAPFIMHRNPKYFSEPEKFIPERFSVENIAKIKPFTYIPFSAGQRNCIGQKFAMLDMKSVLSKILRNFVVLPDEGFTPILSYEIILKTKSGLNIRLEKRL